MSLHKKKFRELVFQILYSLDLGQGAENDIIPLLSKELKVTKKNVRDAFEYSHSISEKLSEIDDKIRKISKSYDFERIHTVERNLIRLAMYELFFETETLPPKVAIAEAIRLTRKFSSPESASFVNAILDAAYQEILGQKSDIGQIKASVEALEESEELARRVIEEQNP